MRYYRIGGSLDESFKWISVPLAPDGSEIDVWQFSQCQRLNALVPITFSVKAKGQQPDFAVTTYSIPLASEKCLRLIQELAGPSIEVIPVDLQDGGKMFVVNILSCVDCLDRQQSRIEYFPSGFPDQRKAHKPRMIVDLRIDKKLVQGEHIFRIKDWELPIIVSEDLVQQFDRHSLLGYIIVGEV